MVTLYGGQRGTAGRGSWGALDQRSEADRGADERRAAVARRVPKSRSDYGLKTTARLADESRRLGLVRPGPRRRSSRGRSRPASGFRSGKTRAPGGRRRALLLVVQLSSERAGQAVRQDYSFATKQEPSPALLVVVPRGHPRRRRGDARVVRGSDSLGRGAIADLAPAPKGAEISTIYPVRHAAGGGTREVVDATAVVGA
jgi:hypothetical protein